MWIARQWAPGRYLQQRRADRSQQDGDTREADDRRHSVGKDDESKHFIASHFKYIKQSLITVSRYPRPWRFYVVSLGLPNPDCSTF